MPRALTAKQSRFVEEYMLDLCATQAAIRAGYSPATAPQVAFKLLRQPTIAQRIYDAKLERSKRTGITADNVLREYWLRATADARELAEIHVGCCRYCHGTDFQYQRTRGELARARAKWTKAHPTIADATPDAEKFDEQGGEGFNATRPPHANCPECFGKGVARQYAHDTRSLSPGAQRLYAGFRITNSGVVEVKTHNPQPALDKVAEHLGLFVERVELSGPQGGPIPVSIDEHRARIAGRLAGIASRMGSRAPGTGTLELPVRANGNGARSA